MAKEKLIWHFRSTPGYDIKKHIDGTISFFWNGSFGNIYPALKDMDIHGLITKSNTSVGGRDRTTYHITESGINMLKKWLRDEQAGNELKYETLLKLFWWIRKPGKLGL